MTRANGAQTRPKRIQRSQTSNTKRHYENKTFTGTEKLTSGDGSCNEVHRLELKGAPLRSQAPLPSLPIPSGFSWGMGRRLAEVMPSEMKQQKRY